MMVTEVRREGMDVPMHNDAKGVWETGREAIALVAELWADSPVAVHIAALME